MIYQNHSTETFFEMEEKLDSSYTSLHFSLYYCYLYYVLFIILLGLVGNLLSCVVFLKTHLKQRSSSYYLAALAITDFSFLMSQLLAWVSNIFRLKYFFINNGWCKTAAYVNAVCRSLSVWLIVAFTMERFIAVQYPLHRPHMCTVARAKRIILVLTILALVSHSYYFVIVEKDQVHEICAILKIEYMETIFIIGIIDTIASLIVPFALIVVLNTMIIRNLLKSGRRFNQEPGYIANCLNRENSDINLKQIPSANSSNNGGGGNMNLVSLVDTNGTRRPPSQQSSFHSSKNHSRHQPASVPPSTPRNVCQITEIEAPCIDVRSSGWNLGSTRHNQENITKMLVLISTVFILLNLPTYVIDLCVSYFVLGKHVSVAVLYLQRFFILLYYTHFSINFLLYAMCGITFRQCLKKILRGILKSITRYRCNPQRESVSA